MAVETVSTARSTSLQKLLNWARRVQIERKLAYIFLGAGITLGIATFIALNDRLPSASDTWFVVLLLYLDLVPLLGLAALIARRLVIIWMAHKRGMAGAKLHARLVGLFSLVAVTPAIIVATFSVVLFDFGLQNWFSQRVSTAITESLAVAEAYLDEHRRLINGDVLAMAYDIDQQGQNLIYNPNLFNQFVAQQTAFRDLTEAQVTDGTGRIIARSGFSLLLDFDPRVPQWAMRRASDGEVVLLTAETDDRVRALVRLNSFEEAYLLVGRLVEPKVLGHMDRTNDAVQLYQELEGKRSGLQLSFALIFVVVALLLLLGAVWVGLTFANHLTRPIGELIQAAEQVRQGDLTARVNEKRVDKGDEISTLARAFNRMTGELGSQRQELLDTNRELDDRRRFIEAVLAGVSAGVIGLDRQARITHLNRSASELLLSEPNALLGRELGATLPEVDELLSTANRRPGRICEGQITLSTGEGRQRTLFVRVTAELGEGGVDGYVLTFDDITELLSAQRKAAWSDVARRIAHEIKNPLTPIQLSAERIKKKYLDQIQKDPETFRICTDTIVRHVGDIGRMVDEFSSFARMPAPEISDQDLVSLVEQSVFLQKTAHPAIEFDCALPSEPVITACDSQQINQALTNLLQNAIDSIHGRAAVEPEAPPGRIQVTVVSNPKERMITVRDNGRGLPKKERHRLTEPYVTTRERGTGLGLAIVKKIMEDHGGDLKLEDNPTGGASVSLVFATIEEPPRGDPPATAAS